ncbi:MAG: sigma-54 dependent transcriptional regulator [Acidobacteria bacterium]|nr:sigma-54 dependent transcriptional regulator [Acidobacteriota bacterium]
MATASAPAIEGSMPRILIVDDEQSMREWLRILFHRDGFDVLIAEDGAVARELLAREFVDVVLTDIRMPRVDGATLLQSLRDVAPDVVVCMMTAHWTRDSGEWKSARDMGAAALFEKPFRDVNLVTLQVRQLIDARRIRHERDVLRQALEAQGFAGIIGRSAPMLEVFRLIETVCRTNSTILITGESGTGKELIARATHGLSLRRDQTFVAVNCGALPETLLESELFGHVRGAFTGADTNKKGLVEVADKGTIFLDEIAEMSPTMQVKLLRVLQERKYRRVGGTEEVAANIRVIAATNCDLPKAVTEGKFREDLFYRLNVIPIHLPALRERHDDVPLIASHFLTKYTREMGKRLSGFSEDALGLLSAYPWPGNVRELENVVERSVALEQSELVRAVTLPENLRVGRPVTPVGGGAPAASLPDSGFSLEDHLQEIERMHLERALKQSGGVQVRAAELLGITFRQFRYLAKKYQLR